MRHQPRALNGAAAGLQCSRSSLDSKPALFISLCQGPLVRGLATGKLRVGASVCVYLLCIQGGSLACNLGPGLCACVSPPPPPSLPEPLPAVGRAGELGPLVGGHLFDCSSGLARMYVRMRSIILLGTHFQAPFSAGDRKWKPWGRVLQCCATPIQCSTLYKDFHFL